MPTITTTVNPVGSNLVWSASLLTPIQRTALLDQRGCVVWLTGLSGAGKSTISKALELRLVRSGRFAYVLDGDNVRHGLNRDLGFSPEHRHENIRRVSEVARLFADAGCIVVVAFISPYAADRAAAREAARGLPFIEVHIHAALAVCEARDPKGLYRKARAGLIKDFTGLDAPYEPPVKPEVRIDTGRESIEAGVEAVMRHLDEIKVLSPYSAEMGGYL